MENENPLTDKNNENEKKMYCINCGKKGHVYKKCLCPIISIGIICIKFKINDLDLNHLF